MTPFSACIAETKAGRLAPCNMYSSPLEKFDRPQAAAVNAIVLPNIAEVILLTFRGFVIFSSLPITKFQF